MSTEERFAAVCRAAQQNVKASLDLISATASHTWRCRRTEPRPTKGGYGWYNDAKKQKTVQNGHARGVTALFLQLIDSSIAAIARDKGWDQPHRLPAGWFRATAPAGDSRYPNIAFWGGQDLHRVS
ncbi:hypothetical protein [Streptomyces luteolus]|uniref:Uncharacterized protein n=1 Tax=Streptomyces luteolus TaxID=3043615 RepID=A0ABT6SQV3_9ACTN|nr:hypothetical protein [Streptomyces sp. B-S-A12]MDI3417993.1 hypothetical protein [Streptomyces sp. B-S-A12]